MITILKILYDRVDITNYVKDFIKSFIYIDNVLGVADDITLTLEDKEGLWQGDWHPEKDDVLEIIIDGNLSTGIMYIDEIISQGTPSELKIMAKSIPAQAKEKHSRAWENVRLSQIAQDIADSLGFQLIFECDIDPIYNREDQVEQSDLEFLHVLTNREAVILKVSNQKIVLIDEYKYDNLKSIGEIDKYADNISEYWFRNTSTGVYRACQVQYLNSLNGELIDYYFEPVNSLKTMPVLKINYKVDSIATAERLAKKSLRKANKNEITGFLTIPGDSKFMAGVNINLAGFRHFDSKYAITKTIHEFQKNYNTTLYFRKVLEGY